MFLIEVSYCMLTKAAFSFIYSKNSKTVKYCYIVKKLFLLYV